MWNLLSIYWKNKDSRRSWLLVGLVILCSAIDIAGSVYLNHWRGVFWGDIEAKNTVDFWHQILVFTGVAFVLIYNSAIIAYILGHIALQWRQWLNWHFFHKWVDDVQLDNPDQRLADDVNRLTADTTILFSGMMSNLATAIVFSYILWDLSKVVSSIPGILVIAAWGYALVGSLITFLVGSKLIPIEYNYQQAEASYRYSLVLKKQKLAEDFKETTKNFSNVVEVTKLFLARAKKVSFVTYGYSQAAAIFPILIVAPAYFIGRVTFGFLMQSVNAISSCQESLSYLINSYQFVATWKATCNRVKQFERQLR